MYYISENIKLPLIKALSLSLSIFLFFDRGKVNSDRSNKS